MINCCDNVAIVIGLYGKALLIMVDKKEQIYMYLSTNKKLITLDIPLHPQSSCLQCLCVNKSLQSALV